MLISPSNVCSAAPPVSSPHTPLFLTEQVGWDFSISASFPCYNSFHSGCILLCSTLERNPAALPTPCLVSLLGFVLFPASILAHCSLDLLSTSIRLWPQFIQVLCHTVLEIAFLPAPSKTPITSIWGLMTMAFTAPFPPTLWSTTELSLRGSEFYYNHSLLSPHQNHPQHFVYNKPQFFWPDPNSSSFNLLPNSRCLLQRSFSTSILLLVYLDHCNNTVIYKGQNCMSHRYWNQEIQDQTKPLSQCLVRVTFYSEWCLVAALSWEKDQCPHW